MTAITYSRVHMAIKDLERGMHEAAAILPDHISLPALRVLINALRYVADEQAQRGPNVVLSNDSLIGRVMHQYPTARIIVWQTSAMSVDDVRMINDAGYQISVSADRRGVLVILSSPFADQTLLDSLRSATSDTINRIVLGASGIVQDVVPF